MTHFQRNAQGWLKWTIALAGLAASPAWANLVVNPGFETGNIIGWTLVDAPEGSDFYIGESGAFPFNSHSGNYMAVFGATENQYDSISQTISTTPGQYYDVSFWLQTDGPTNEPGDDDDDTSSLHSQISVYDTDFQAYWNGSLLTDYSPMSEDPVAYALYSFNVQATSSSTTLLFQGFDAPGHVLLDDISVTAASVPEPGAFWLAGAGLLLPLLRRLSPSLCSGRRPAPHPDSRPR